MELFLIVTFVYNLISLTCGEIDNNVLKCLVCQRTAEEIDKEITKVDPKKTIEVGSISFDGSNKKVEYRKSEVYLTEMMEKICDKFDDFVRARRKSDGQLLVFPLVTETGGMNPIMGEVDVIQDSDLNRSLKFYCQGILDEFNEEFIDILSKDYENIEKLVEKMCTDSTNLCGAAEQCVKEEL